LGIDCELGMHLLKNLEHLGHAFRTSFREPAVKGVAALAATLILFASVFYWLVEGWSPLDCLYFSVTTIATVGYGDITPQTPLGKLFTIFYIVAGIGIFAAAVTALAQAVLRNETTPGD
jgi:voltage-gated potassium channel